MGPPAKSHQLGSVLGHRGRFIAPNQAVPSWPGLLCLLGRSREFLVDGGCLGRLPLALSPLLVFGINMEPSNLFIFPTRWKLGRGSSLDALAERLGSGPAHSNCGHM